ncbi:hypothetical protein [Urechidicola vernalis]|uniref:Uncharacterized protein n=1 Tax=Urechidicola vernalis TaxID=3075600 RepID=A0ABU2Y9G7_9FLAO|nr:hypothetical protein [Urechidicola sp. P050]MDT0553708.1 hypothetical protein [Urechidicola sp. P050]
MKSLENKILLFDNWSKPWTFKKSIEDTLNKNELNLFKEICIKAGDFQLWNYSDLLVGCSMCERFLKDRYELSDEAITNIVRALSYEWK